MLEPSAMRTNHRGLWRAIVHLCRWGGLRWPPGPTVHNYPVLIMPMYVKYLCVCACLSGCMRVDMKLARIEGVLTLM